MNKAGRFSLSKEQLVSVTKEAILKIENPRYFQTERGYQMEFYSLLKELLPPECNLTNDRMLEGEPQKTKSVHGTNQRPDIIFHIPRKNGTAVDENNYCLWALKLRGNKNEAKSDFDKLNEMFLRLKYSFGLWINIDSSETWINEYKGIYQQRIGSFAVKLKENKPNVVFEFVSSNQKVVKNIYQ